MSPLYTKHNVMQNIGKAMDMEYSNQIEGARATYLCCVENACFILRGGNSAAAAARLSVDDHQQLLTLAKQCLERVERLGASATLRPPAADEDTDEGLATTVCGVDLQSNCPVDIKPSAPDAESDYVFPTSSSLSTSNLHIPDTHYQQPLQHPASLEDNISCCDNNRDDDVITSCQPPTPSGVQSTNYNYIESSSNNVCAQLADSDVLQSLPSACSLLKTSTLLAQTHTVSCAVNPNDIRQEDVEENDWVMLGQLTLKDDVVRRSTQSGSPSELPVVDYALLHHEEARDWKKFVKSNFLNLMFLNPYTFSVNDKHTSAAKPEFSLEIIQATNVAIESGDTHNCAVQPLFHSCAVDDIPLNAAQLHCDLMMLAGGDDEGLDGDTAPCPADVVRRDAERLVASYTARINNSPTHMHHELRLELQRRLTESRCVATMRNRVWRKHRDQQRQQYLRSAEKLLATAPAGSYNGADVVDGRAAWRRRQVAALADALQYEASRPSAQQIRRRLRQRVGFDAADVRCAVMHALLEKSHPLARSRQRMQYALYCRMRPLIEQHSQLLTDVKVPYVAAPPCVVEPPPALVRRPVVRGRARAVVVDAATERRQQEAAFSRHLRNIVADLRESISSLYWLVLSVYPSLCGDARWRQCVAVCVQRTLCTPLWPHLRTVYRLANVRHESLLAAAMTRHQRTHQADVSPDPAASGDCGCRTLPDAASRRLLHRILQSSCALEKCGHLVDLIKHLCAGTAPSTCVSIESNNSSVTSSVPATDQQRPGAASPCRSLSPAIVPTPDTTYVSQLDGSVNVSDRSVRNTDASGEIIDASGETESVCVGGADDLLPRLTAAVVWTGAPQWLSEMHYMSDLLSEKDGYTGQHGYCLTSLHTVLLYLIGEAE